MQRTSVQVGKFRVWPDSDSGSRPNDLFIQSDKEKMLLKTEPNTFYAQWNWGRWPIANKAFESLSKEEQTVLRSVGMNLPRGSSSFAEATSKILLERITKVGTDRLEMILEKIFSICRKEMRRIERARRPFLIRWLPI